MVVEYQGATYYVVEWQGFSKEALMLAVSSGYPSGIAWWLEKVQPWLYANTTGHWFWGGQSNSSIPEGYYFEVQADAILFKLTWHLPPGATRLPCHL